MRPYEEILNKIAPVFYKLLQYYRFRFNNVGLLDKYFSIAKLPRIYHVDVIDLLNNSSYFYEKGLDKFRESTYIEILRLTTKNNIDTYYDSYIDDFIVNMVINKFSFENKKITSWGGVEGYDNTYKDLFIALVGKDTYETIRNNIK